MADKPGKGDETQTERQKKWLASVSASMEAETGRTMAEWVEIANTCPETSPHNRVLWFKINHGLGQNRANVILAHAFPESGPGGQPQALRAALWKDVAKLVVLQAVEARLKGLPGLVSPQRKGYTPWAREFTFAAMKPVKAGVLLGLAVLPEADARLSPATGKEGWSERLTATVLLTAPDQVDAGLSALLRQAFEAS